MQFYGFNDCHTKQSSHLVICHVANFMFLCKNKEFRPFQMQIRCSLFTTTSLEELLL